MTPYSSLTPAQREQANSLFLDARFGTDPNNYLYELKGADLQNQRTPLGKETLHCGRINQVRISTTNIPHLTDHFIHTLTGWVLEDLLKAAGDVPPVPATVYRYPVSPAYSGADQPE
jgi:hypothetical protein